MTTNPMTRALSGRTLRLMIGLLILVEAHFLADSLATLIEIVVGNGGTVVDTGLLLFLTSPEVVDFALPLVILIGLYFAIVGARDDNELVVCAAAGVAWTKVPGFALRVGVLGCLISLMFAGFLTPMAKYAFRLAIHAIETREVLEQIASPDPRSTIRQVKKRTVIAAPPEMPGVERGNLFIFDPGSGAGWRVSQAGDWAVEGPDELGGYAIRLKGFREYREPRPDNLSPDQDEIGLSGQIDFARINVQNVALDFRLDEVVRGQDRAPRGNERLLFTLAALGGSGAEAVVNQRFGRVMGRGLLCVFAAMMAVVAAAASSRPGWQLFALPLAAVVVMAADILARTVLADAATVGPLVFWASAAGVAAGAVVLPMLYIAREAEAMLAPARGRA